MQDHHVCSCPSAYWRLLRSFLPPQNISSSMTKRHNIGPRRGAVPCRGCYDYCLWKMTSTDVLLASPPKEDENKKDRPVSARRWADCGGDEGTSLLHNFGASLNIIVMKMQPVPCQYCLCWGNCGTKLWQIMNAHHPLLHNPTSRLSLAPFPSSSYSRIEVLFTTVWLLLNPLKRNARIQCKYLILKYYLEI